MAAEDARRYVHQCYSRGRSAHRRCRNSASGNITLIQGRLDIGVAMAPPLIRGVKAHLHDGLPAILDAPPGTSCPVIATLRDSDFVLLVTEPTPFGLHDLKLAVEMVRKSGSPLESL